MQVHVRARLRLHQPKNSPTRYHGTDSLLQCALSRRAGKDDKLESSCLVQTKVQGQEPGRMIDRQTVDEEIARSCRPPTPAITNVAESLGQNFVG